MELDPPGAAQEIKVSLVKMEPGFGEYVQPNGEHIYYYCDRVLDQKLSLEEAKEVVRLLFSEFPLDDQSWINATARLLTPHCQGLMGWRKRSPLWVFTANKPRSGKDYLAMLTPLAHAHYANQDPPLETDDEVKRRITAALMSGRRFMHFANCRKELNNPSLEAAVTAEYWTDRVIRSSTEATVPNEIIFSLSYNDSLPMTADIAARMRVIRLNNTHADANLRTFEMTNLHEMVSRATPFKGSPSKKQPKHPICRVNILAALEAFIRKWVADGCPPLPSSEPVMASYPEWTRVVAGIMYSAGLGNPCKPDNTLVPATFDDWGGELLQLAQVVCAISSAEDKFETCDLTKKFILPNPSLFPTFSKTIGRIKEAGFNSELGQYIMKRIGKPMATKDALYFIQRDGVRSSNVWRFLKRITGQSCEDDYTI